MEVPVVIDGNNLLYAARAAEPSNLLIGRSMLCDTLGKWAQRRRQQVRVVFDGPAPPAPLAEQIGHPALQILYSAPRSADEVVAELVENDSAARRLLVVSTDREIARAASRRRARTMRSEEFWAGVQRDLARPPRNPVEPNEKKAGLTAGGVEAWLQEFGLADRPPENARGMQGSDDSPTPSQ